MPARLFIVLVMCAQALIAWPGTRALTDSVPVGAAAAFADDADACAGSCCCPPKACPCAHAPAPGERSKPAPATPPGNDTREVPTVAIRSIDRSLLGHDDVDAERESSAAEHESGRPLGDLTRRVQQLQCVWRT